jgi:aminobenzoyl-glutamate transport protein
VNKSVSDKRLPSVLNIVERIGNFLPYPVTLFALMALTILIFSAIASALGLQVADPRSADGAAVSIRAVNLLNADGIARVLTSLVPNFTNFAPLGTVLVALLGVGVAEKSGLIEAAVRKIVYSAPRRLITYAIVFAAVMSNVAGELGYVVLIPLSATIFRSLGRHPLAGIAAAFAGVSGGYSANLLLGTVDPLLAGITQASAQLVAPGYIVGAAANWYFMASSTIIITVLGALVTERIVEPRLGTYVTELGNPTTTETSTHNVTSAKERNALRAAGWTIVCCVALLVAVLVPESSPLRDAQGQLGPKAPLYASVVAFIFLFFLLPGIVYGMVAGTIRSDKDVIDSMSSTMSSMGAYIVLVFFAAQFIAFFNWSQLGQIVAVAGANALQALALPAPILFTCFILICAFANLAVGSASAQWALTAPVFVPMLMLLGFAPEITQAAYRIGDSVTNLITPMMSYFGLIVAVAARYRKNIGVGTLMSMMLPYSAIFLAAWTAMFCIWVFVLHLPVGPGSPIYFSPTAYGH